MDKRTFWTFVQITTLLCYHSLLSNCNCWRSAC